MGLKISSRTAHLEWAVRELIFKSIRSVERLKQLMQYWCHCLIFQIPYLPYFFYVLRYSGPAKNQRPYTMEWIRRAAAAVGVVTPAVAAAPTVVVALDVHGPNTIPVRGGSGGDGSDADGRRSSSPPVTTDQMPSAVRDGNGGSGGDGGANGGVKRRRSSVRVLRR